MSTSLLHLAQLVLSFLAICFLLSSLAIIIKTNGEKELRRHSRLCEPKMKRWASIFKRHVEPLTGSVGHKVWNVLRILGRMGVNLEGALIFAGIYTVALGGVTYEIAKAPQITFYGLRVQRVLSNDALMLTSQQTGPFRADFCPDVHMNKYEPREGYVMCRLTYRDRGCMDISGHNGSLTWVKDAYGWTATLRDSDTFRPFPVCEKETAIARQTGSEEIQRPRP